MAEAISRVRARKMSNNDFNPRGARGLHASLLICERNRKSFNSNSRPVSLVLVNIYELI